MISPLSVYRCCAIKVRVLHTLEPLLNAVGRLSFVGIEYHDDPITDDDADLIEPHLSCEVRKNFQTAVELYFVEIAWEQLHDHSFNFVFVGHKRNYTPHAKVVRLCHTRVVGSEHFHAQRRKNTPTVHQHFALITSDLFSFF